MQNSDTKIKSIPISFCFNEKVWQSVWGEKSSPNSIGIWAALAKYCV